ncbi:DNRLRE domain-containing protein [Nonomuraea ferruginea]
MLKSKGGKGSATIGSPGELPKPTLKGSTATYPSLYGKGIDLVVTATATGFKQEIVLRERVTGPVSFRIPTTVPKNLALEEDAAGKPALLSQGKKIADLPPALLLDAVAADLDSDADAGKVGKAAVTLDQSASALVYTPDPAYLADPAVAYPVTLAAFDDDWWEPELGNDTFVNNADYPNGYANSGLDRILVGKSNSGAVRWRSYIRFDEFPADHPIRGATIQNADLVLWNHLSSDCGLFVGSGITAYQVTERWDVSTLTWSSQPRITTTGADTEYAELRQHELHRRHELPMGPHPLRRRHRPGMGGRRAELRLPTHRSATSPTSRTGAATGPTRLAAAPQPRGKTAWAHSTHPSSPWISSRRSHPAGKRSLSPRVSRSPQSLNTRKPSPSRFMCRKRLNQSIR